MTQEILHSKEPLLARVGLVIFDWSGVISDDRYPVYLANMKCLEPVGRKMAFDEWLAKTQVSVVEFLLAEGLNDSPEVLYALYKQFLDEVIASGVVPTLYPKVSEVFPKLRALGKALAVLSAHPEENLRHELRVYGLGDYFQAIQGNVLDKTQGLKVICNQIKASPSSAIYIGDTIFDIRAAKNAGLFSAGICTGYHSRVKLLQEHQDIILETLSDLFPS